MCEHKRRPSHAFCGRSFFPRQRGHVGRFLASLRRTGKLPNRNDSALLPCRNRLKVEGHLDLGSLTNYLFVFADGSQQAVWQGKTGYYGDVALDSISATEQNVSGNVPPFEGTLTSNAPPGLWQSIVDNNPPNAIGVVDASEVLKLETELNTALDNIAHLPTTQGFVNLSARDLNGFNSENHREDFFVMDITKGFEIGTKINVQGDANDIFLLRWDTDGNPLNGYQGKVYFKDCGAIVPKGGLMASNFVHVAGEIMASTGDVNCQVPAAPYPQGPRRGGKGTLELITGGRDWPAGGGFFTGYWLTTGDPVDGGTSLEDARFVGGWYTKAKSFWMKDVNGGGVHICPVVLPLEASKSNSCQKSGPQFLLFTFLFLFCLLGTYCV
eukprot:g33266.t1